MVLDKPGYQVTIHINIYLSTSGKETEFVQELALLEDTIDAASEAYPDSIIFIRGDANASVIPRNKNQRDLLFQHFLTNNSLASLSTNISEVMVGVVVGRERLQHRCSLEIYIYKRRLSNPDSGVSG